VKALPLVAAIIVCGPASIAAAQYEGYDEYGAYSDIPATGEFSLGIGYANISIGDEALDNEDALKFDPSLTFSIARRLPQLRVGMAVGVSLVLDDSNRTIISNDGNLVVIGHSDVPLWLVEPEARLSWRQYFGDDYQLFIEPGVAAGWTYGYLDIGADDLPTGDSYSEGDSTWHTRVFLRLGARMQGGFGGIEASWMRGGDLDLAENADGELEEFYIGIFGALTF
jgi:hypothetical protein